MPRQSKPSVLDSEDNVAAHIQGEREARAWSTGHLAKLVTEAGCPISQSAIWRIENGEPRRKISVDELIAFGKVFDMTVDEMLQPREAGASVRQIKQHIEDWLDLEEQATEIHGGIDIRVAELVGLAWAEPELEERVVQLLGEELEQRPRHLRRRLADGLADRFREEMEKAREAGRPQYGPTPLQILAQAQQREAPLENVRAVASKWGILAVVEDFIRRGNTRAVDMQTGKSLHASLGDVLLLDRERYGLEADSAETLNRYFDKLREQIQAEPQTQEQSAGD